MLLVGCSQIALAQTNGREGIESIRFRDSNKEIVDLTKVVEKSCTESLKRIVGENDVLLGFQPEYREEAELIVNRLALALRETQAILNPLEVQDVRFYLLHLDQVPTNYKMRKKFEDKKFYLQLFTFKDREDLNLGICSTAGLCSDVFDTVPHELTHSALDDLINRRKTRWFDDGFAEFIANSVYEKLLPAGFKKKYQSASPQLSLYRKDIRQNILRWDERDLGILKITEKELSNEIYRYLAAFELVRQIFDKAKEKGISRPLSTLLLTLSERRRLSGKPAGSGDLISIIRESLKVDPRALGDLDKQTQKNYVTEAISLLSQDDLTTEKKNYALYTLACIDEIAISNDWIIYLLDQVFKNKASDDNQRDIAATALVARFDQEGFDEILKRYKSDNPKLRGKPIIKIKSELADFSLCPRIH